MLGRSYQRYASPLRRWRFLRVTTTIPILLLFTVIASLLVIMHESTSAETPLEPSVHSPTHPRYTALSGYFLQSLPSTDPSDFDFKAHSFGLIGRDYDSDSTLPAGGKEASSWQRFEHHISTLNTASPAGTSYRLLFLGRHGQGFHNVAESYYGTEAWDCYWSTLEGNSTISWADARLTKLGIKQAEEVRDFWRKMREEEKIKFPESWYLSPLDRAIDTADVTFRDLLKDEGVRFKPRIVKELLREANGIHTCDRRSKRSEIAERWPDFEIEEAFTELDKLWRSDLRESRSAHIARLEQLLDDVFEHDDNTWISMTAHGGTIGVILDAVGHRRFALQTGGVIPVLVKVERVTGKKPEEKIDPWQPKPDCDGDPSLARRNGYRDFEEYAKDLGLVT